MLHYSPHPSSSFHSPAPVFNFSYSTSELIGKGFTSQVYKGISNITGFPLAIKVIDKTLLQEQDRKLIKSQIISMKKLRGKSPYVLNLVQVNEVGQTVFIVTEQCDFDLAKILQEKRLSQKQAIEIMEQIIRGYLCIASHGVVHRDLKPANVFLKNGHVKIGDFGFAIGFQECATCHNVGSPLYMSPEAMELTQYSVKSDIWALGITFYEMLFGSVPWDAENQQQLFEKVTSIPIAEILKGKIINENCSLFLRMTLNVNPNFRMSLKQLEQFSFKPSRTLTTLRTQPNLPSPINQNNHKHWDTFTKHSFPPILPFRFSHNISATNTTHASLESSLVNDTDKSETNKSLRSQLNLCEYFLTLYIQIYPISLERKDRLKKTFQKFIQRKLLQIKQCLTQNPFKLTQLQYFRSTPEFMTIQAQTANMIQKFKQVFNIQTLSSFIGEGNYREMKEEIMNNITGMFIDSGRQEESGVKVDRKFVLDSLVTAYDIIRSVSLDDAVTFSKTGNIQKFLSTIKNKGLK